MLLERLAVVGEDFNPETLMKIRNNQRQVDRMRVVTSDSPQGKKKQRAEDEL